MGRPSQIARYRKEAADKAAKGDLEGAKKAAENLYKEQGGKPASNRQATRSASSFQNAGEAVRYLKENPTSTLVEGRKQTSSALRPIDNTAAVTAAVLNTQSGQQSVRSDDPRLAFQRAAEEAIPAPQAQSMKPRDENPNYAVDPNVAQRSRRGSETQIPTTAVTSVDLSGLNVPVAPSPFTGSTISARKPTWGADGPDQDTSQFQKRLAYETRAREDFNDAARDFDVPKAAGALAPAVAAVSIKTFEAERELAKDTISTWTENPIEAAFWTGAYTIGSFGGWPGVGVVYGLQETYAIGEGRKTQTQAVVQDPYGEGVKLGTIAVAGVGVGKVVAKVPEVNTAMFADKTASVRGGQKSKAQIRNEQRGVYKPQAQNVLAQGPNYKVTSQQYDAYINQQGQIEPAKVQLIQGRQRAGDLGTNIVTGGRIIDNVGNVVKEAREVKFQSKGLAQTISQAEQARIDARVDAAIAESKKWDLRSKLDQKKMQIKSFFNQAPATGQEIVLEQVRTANQQPSQTRGQTIKYAREPEPNPAYQQRTPVQTIGPEYEQVRQSPGPLQMQEKTYGGFRPGMREKIMERLENQRTELEASRAIEIENPTPIVTTGTGVSSLQRPTVSAIAISNIISEARSSSTPKIEQRQVNQIRVDLSETQGAKMDALQVQSIAKEESPTVFATPISKTRSTGRSSSKEQNKLSEFVPEPLPQINPPKPYEPPFRPVLRSPAKVEPPIESKGLFSPREIPNSKDKALYAVEVRRKGQFQTVSPAGGLSLESAFKKGKSVVSNTAAASFRIIPATIQASDKGVSNPFLGGEFRKSKREKNVIVQKNKFRIRTPGEKQEITVKGIASSKSKSKRKVRSRWEL